MACAIIECESFSLFRVICVLGPIWCSFGTKGNARRVVAAMNLDILLILVTIGCVLIVNGLGHEASRCPSPVFCSICRDEGHKARFCKYSWLRSNVVKSQATDELRAIDVEGLVSPPHEVETPCVPRIGS